MKRALTAPLAAVVLAVLTGCAPQSPAPTPAPATPHTTVPVTTHQASDEQLARDACIERFSSEAPGTSIESAEEISPASGTTRSLLVKGEKNGDGYDSVMAMCYVSVTGGVATVEQFDLSD